MSRYGPSRGNDGGNDPAPAERKCSQSKASSQGRSQLGGGYAIGSNGAGLPGCRRVLLLRDDLDRLLVASVVRRAEAVTEAS
jgi:hypothetical protein